MKKLNMLCADIPLEIILKNDNLCAQFLDQFKVERTNEKPTIKIEAAIKARPGLTSSITESNKPPTVILSNGSLTVMHAYYEGTYDLGKNVGMVSATDYSSLLCFIRIICSVVIIDQGGLAIHSSCVLRNDKAYIFSGPSGYGKSTIVRFTENPLLYSDEVTLVKKDESGVFKVYHSPFRSEFHTEPLRPTDNIASIYFLNQDTRVYTRPLYRSKAVFKLLPNIFFPITGRTLYGPKIFHLCCDFLRQVKPVIMHFKKDNSFWRCIDEGCI